VTAAALEGGPSVLDVAIVGGGLAGNLLARQLRRAAPQLTIGLFEQEAATSFKVGEATVEIAANYLVRRLGLSTYLYEHQLPKNGLRYFFDTAERDCPLEQMSEVGSVSLPFHPAFQLDRARFEADLLTMNRRDGVQLHLGARVEDLELGSGGGHRFAVVGESGTNHFEARWLIDAAGRNGFLARRLGLRVDEQRHRIGSVWGRFEGVVDIDGFGSDAFRSRIRYAPRRLSTIHFWYRGYWIWFIPLRGGLTSVGVTGACVGRERELRTQQGFLRFLERHHAVATLLRGARLLDLGSLARIAYSTKRFIRAEDRWGLTGEAATAADPLYSPGSDFIALENDFLSDLIVREAAGESETALAERADLYDDFLKFRQRATMLLYEGLYDTLGSFEVACAKWDLDIGLYYNLWVTAYLRDQHLDAEFLRAQLRLEPFVLRVMRNFALLFRRVAERLDGDGHYHRANTGRFYHGLSNIDFAERVGGERSEAEVMATTLDLFNRVRAQAAVLLGEVSCVATVEPQPMSAFLGRHPVL
jgi:flavin-dependent dehydrogenase